MQWELLTAPKLARAREKAQGVAILPIGSLEKHGEHMPTGIDTLSVHKKAIEAAKLEPAVVLPPLFFTYVIEAKNCIGAISLKTELLLQVVENICDEVARNGFKRIILYSGHGGNRFWLPLMMQHFADKGKDYAAYMLRLGQDERLKALRESKVPEAHAGEMETSVALFLYPDSCDMEALPKEPGQPQEVPKLPAYTPVDWYSKYPNQYAGDARQATAEKGQKAFNWQVERLAQAIKEIKKDTFTLAKMKELGQEMHQV
jgi:creatinine amidohydrolase